MTILGINAYHADSSAAIFVDGKMVAATEEERFTRVKHWAGFPELAIKFCLKEDGITLDQLHYIAIGRDPKAKFKNKMAFLAKNPLANAGMILDRLKNAKNVSSLEEEFAKAFGVSAESVKPKIHQVEHHRSHLASAFFASPFD